MELLPHEARPEGFVLLAVPDRAIAELAEAFPGRCAHLSGSLHFPEVPGLHPLTSFNGTVENWEGTPLALDGHPPAWLTAAFAELGFLPFALDPKAKALYHACAVLTSGHAATLWLGAQSLMAARGVSLPGHGFLPLAEATLRNVAARGEAGRTGPFVRGDAETIAMDAEALPPEWREIFLKLGAL